MSFLTEMFKRKTATSTNGHAPRFTALIENDEEDERFDYLMKGAAEDFASGASSQASSEESVGTLAEKQLNFVANFTWVYVAIMVRARNVSSVPKRCVRLRKKNVPEDLNPNHPLCKLIKKPNKWQTQRRWSRRYQMHKDATGMAFVLMDEGQADEMFLLKPERVRILPDPVKFIKGYRYDVNKKPFYYSPDQVWFDQHEDPRSEYVGLSPLSAAQRPIQSEDFIWRWNNSTFRNGCRVDQVLETDATVERSLLKRIVAEFFQTFRGAENAGKTMVLQAGLKLKQLGLSPKDTEFLAQRKINWREILAIYGVTPVMAGVTEEVNYATANEQKKNCWESTLVPQTEDQCEALTENVAVRWGDDLAIIPDFSGIEALKENANERTTRTVAQWAGGLVSRNEAREELDEDPLPPEQGDVWLLPAGARLINAAGEDVTPANPNAPDPNMLPGGADDVADDDEDEKPEPEKAFAQTYASKEYRDLAWKSFDRSARRKIGSFSRQVATFFDGQKERVLAKFCAFKPACEQGKSAEQKDIGFDPFDYEEEARKFFEQLRGAYLDAVTDAGESRVDDLGVPQLPTFNGASERVLDYIRNHAARRITNINKETEQQVRDVLDEGARAGDSIDALAARLEKLYDGFSNPLSANEPRFTRADTIARTEVNSSLNFGNHEAEKQAVAAGAELLKIWVANPRPSAREEHVAIGDETAADPIPWDMPFSNGMMYPQAPGAPADEVINCTCTSISFPKSIGSL